MPLDDAFIFFQYGKRLAAGAPFSYQTGDAPTTGATSLLTVAVDGLAYRLGFHGAAMVVFALILGGACLAWASWSAWRLGGRLCPRIPWAPPVLLLATGPLVWGAFSGMDLPIFMALLLAFAARWPEEGEAPDRTFFVLGALLGLARPDAVFLILPAFGLSLGRGRRLGWWAVPFAGLAAPFVIQWALTGSPQSASMDVKSVLGRPGLNVTDWLVQGTAHLAFVVKGVFGGAALGNPITMAANNRSGAPFYLMPFALGLLLLGLVPGAWIEARRRRGGLHALFLLWFVLSLLAQAFTVPSNWHWNRYLMILYVMAIPGIAIGLDRIGTWMESLWSDLRTGDGPRVAAVVAVALSLPGLVYFFVAYGRNCADIRFQHIELAERLNEGDGVDATTVVGVHDVGALAYFGRYRILDLEGLTSREFQKASRLRGAGIWEVLEDLPPARRPDYLAVYASWFDPVFLSMHRPLFTQRQFAPSIAAGNPLAIYAADWSLAGSGDRPAPRPELAGCTLLGEVDVADLASERRAGYRYSILDGAYESLLRRLPDPSGREVVDGGRLVSGGESFTVEGFRPGATVILVARSHAPFRLRVRVNGARAGVWSSMEPGGKAWYESSVPLHPEGSGGTLRIGIYTDDPHHSAYGSFHYWVYQCS